MRFLAALLRSYRVSYAGLPRATWLLALVTAVNRAGSMVVPFLALYFTTELGFGESDAGVLLGAFGAGGLLGAALGGTLADRFGALPVQVATLVLCGAGFFVLGACTTWAQLAVALFAVGAIFTAFRPANAVVLAATCPPAERLRAFAVHRLAINAGCAIGPAVGGFLARVDYSWLFLVDGSVCIACGLLLWVLLRGRTDPHAHEPPEAAGGKARSPWRDGGFLGVMAVSLSAAVITFQWLSTGPLFLHDAYGLAEDEIGLLLAINPVLIVLLEMVLVHALRGRAPLPWIGIGVFLIGASCYLLPLGRTFAWGVVVVVVWTAGEMLESPLTSAFAANRAGAANRGRYMGVFSMMYSVATIVAPVMGTGVYESLGAEVLWYGSGTVGVLGGLAMLWFARRSLESPALRGVRR